MNMPRKEAIEAYSVKAPRDRLRSAQTGLIKMPLQLTNRPMLVPIIRAQPSTTIQP